MTHILRTPCYYIAQTRLTGRQYWDTVNKHRYGTPEAALAAAVKRMRPGVKRARALAIPYGETGQWYEPRVVMEAKML